MATDKAEVQSRISTRADYRTTTSTASRSETVSQIECQHLDLHADLDVVASPLDHDRESWQNAIQCKEEYVAQMGIWHEPDNLDSKNWTLPRAAEHTDLNNATSTEKAAGTTPFDQSGDCYNSSYHGERSDEDRDGQISGEDGDVDNVAAEGRKRQRVKQWLRHSGPRVLHVAATTAMFNRVSGSGFRECGN
ncbi:hypothetical protein Slin15195_G062820 [Septoria linicola]|uniref:Uncharacterized protein n=1 Tax=Septoria linicola TaxID=215465 RepID=A0A9Q9AVP1_9PEZI|nr:hypothetical protein Slin15195_G062820 [Septoria linicola]